MPSKAIVSRVWKLLAEAHARGKQGHYVEFATCPEKKCGHGAARCQTCGKGWVSDAGMLDFDSHKSE